MSNKIFDKRLAAIALCVSATACASMTKPPPGLEPVATSADMHKIKVVQAGERLEIPLAGADGALTPENAALVDNFGKSYREIGHGPLIVSTPAGAADATGAARLAQATRLELAGGGVPYAAISGSSYDAGGRASAPVVLSFSRYDAEAPNCPPVWTEDLSHSPDNKAPASFGCFVNANLAAMVADPADILGPRALDPRDSERRDVVMDKYRKGDPTGATRTDDDRVTISDAIK